VSVLIEAQSAVEPAALQYMQFHTGSSTSDSSTTAGGISGNSGGGNASSGTSSEALERLRYGLSQSGPLQEALDHCLLEMDAASIQGE